MVHLEIYIIVIVKSVPASNHLEKYKEEYDGLIQEIKSRSRKRRKVQDDQLEDIL